METPPSETWQIKIHPTADSLTLAAAGGSSHGIAIWNCENAQKEQDLQIPGVSPSLSSLYCFRPAPFNSWPNRFASFLDETSNFRQDISKLLAPGNILEGVQASLIEDFNCAGSREGETGKVCAERGLQP